MEYLAILTAIVVFGGIAYISFISMPRDADLKH